MRVPFGWLLPTVVAVFLPIGSALGADRLTIAYGLLERSVSIDSLSAYVNEGSIEGDFKDYVRYLEPEQLDNLRRILRTKANLNHVAVAQFLYTDQGEALLRRLGEVIRTDSNLSGFYATRAAMIQAAEAPEGLTPLNVLKQFPLSNIRLDLERTLQILGDLDALVRQTQSAIALIDQQSILEAGAEPWVPLPNLPDLRSVGSYTWQKRTLRLTDPERISQNRSFLTDMYLPNSPRTIDPTLPSLFSANPQPAPSLNAPLIVISHGLGSDRSTYAYLAQQLASYGFAVAVPEHPGSSSQQIQALISGGANEVTAPTEFVDRPLDIRYLLNQLETLSQTDSRFAGRMNLNQVGVIGQSLGGYTALALAGAEINQKQLAQDCQNSDTLNLSLLLQCRALQLPQTELTFRDDRIKAVIAINPIGSSLLGKTDLSKINVPVLIISSTADTVAPALLEQILPFTWLQTPDKYLMLLEGGTHFSVIDAPNATSQNNQVELPTELVGPNPKLAYLYLKAIGVAFFKTYVAEDSQYRTFLSAGYVSRISQKTFPTSFVRSLTAAQLAKIFREVPLEPPPTGFDGNAWSGQ
ncbi:MAG: alpha/beta hydrolase [Timaviella obliquedivisa GSE-PSE-MK23-08B]|jgi:predicted dienelactone hydrolase|nr:alpha/beta hydrolase [Timaviella obliquedivisa GSE-PSE-MK23-08B]